MQLSIGAGAVELNFNPFTFGIYFPSIIFNGNVLSLGNFVIDNDLKEFEIELLYFINRKYAKSLFSLILNPFVFKIDLFFIDSVIKKKL